MNFDVIEQKRKDKNLTITNLCSQAGIDRSTYYRMKDDARNIRFSTVTKLVSVLKLSAAERNKLLH